MQTFLPYEDFQKSAACLDHHRLGKQRVETLEILVILKHVLGDEQKPSWMSFEWYARCEMHKLHPAVLMWNGYECALWRYGAVICKEWKKRGYVENIGFRIYDYRCAASNVVMPWWLGREEFHRSHRSNLLYKDPKFYAQYNWTDGSNWLYWWPTEHTSANKG